MYSYDPLEGVPAASHHKVLGGEVHVWSEAIDGVNLDSVVWPRAAAAAEVLWSGPNNTAGKVRPQPEVAHAPQRSPGAAGGDGGRGGADSDAVLHDGEAPV